MKTKAKSYSHKLYYTLRVCVEVNNDTWDLDDSRQEAEKEVEDILGNIKWHEINSNIELEHLDFDDIESELVEE